MRNDIPVYKTQPVICSNCISGSIQPGSGANFKVENGSRVSFVWSGPDTYADEVFKYFEHSENCEYYKKGPFNYYASPDYVNETPINENESHWEKCTCKATVFSPIGHIGNSALDYYGVTDCLYADPLNLGENFTSFKLCC